MDLLDEQARGLHAAEVGKLSEAWLRQVQVRDRDAREWARPRHSAGQHCHGRVPSLLACLVQGCYRKIFAVAPVRPAAHGLRARHRLKVQSTGATARP